MIPVGRPLPPDLWRVERDRDPLVRRYRAWFALLDWSCVPERDSRRPWPGQQPHPRQAYVKALLLKVQERLPYITRLRAFLVEHPLLVLEVGFRPLEDSSQPWGFDVERTVPGERWLRHQQQTIDQQLLHALLADTVHTLQQVSPDLGTTVAIDVTHAYAWVRENNPKELIAQRFDPARAVRGDPDCRLGVKRRANQDGAAPAELLWGYGIGIASAIDPILGDVVLAEHTQTFNHPDITCFHPLYQQVCQHCGQPPRNLAADAAFDAWHAYQPCVATGGMAAIALNTRGPRPARDPHGHPLCDQGLVMHATSVFQHEDGYRARHYRCPLRGLPDATCADARFAHGGCRKVINLEDGARLRQELDRTSAAFRDIYRQRTSAERINSQATALGIDRPRVRRQAGVARLTTLTAIVINLTVIQRFLCQLLPHAPPVLC